MLFQQIYGHDNELRLSEEQMRQMRVNRWGADVQGPGNLFEEDYSDKFNTELSADEEVRYQTWAKENHREKDVYDYDLRGAWKELQSGAMSEDERGHLGDKYKKPNHPTFSVESVYNGQNGIDGGVWSQNAEGKTVYTPGRKLSSVEADRLQRYFARNEPGVLLDLKDHRLEEKPLPGITQPLDFFDGMGNTWKGIPAAGLQALSSGITLFKNSLADALANSGTEETRRWWRSQQPLMDMAARDIREYNKAHFEVDPETMGTASQIMHGLFKMLPKAVAYSSGLGMAGGALAMGADLGIDETNRLMDEGVDRETAINAGMQSFVWNAIGMRLPPVLGASRTASALYGVGVNIGTNIAETEGIKLVLEHENYDELAKQYELNAVNLAVSAAMGGAFGAAFWRSAAQIRADKYRAEHQKLYEDYRTKLFNKGEGPFTFEQAGTQANINARMVVSFAQTHGIDPDKVGELAPEIVWTKGGKVASSGGEFNMQGAQERLDLLNRSRAFDKELERWSRGEGDASFDMGRPSWVLQLFGTSKDKNISAEKNQFFHVLFPAGAKIEVGGQELIGSHNFSPEELRGLVAGIQRPLAVFKSGRPLKKNGQSIILLTELKRKTRDGEKNVIVPLLLTQDTRSQKLVLNKVLSAYEKNQVKPDWFKQGRLLGVEKTKGLEVVRSLHASLDSKAVENRFPQVRGSISSATDSSRPADGGPTPSTSVVSGEAKLPSGVILYENDTSIGDLYQNIGPKGTRQLDAANGNQKLENIEPVRGFSYELPEAAEVMRSDADQWRTAVDSLTAKPKSATVMFQRTPMIMRLLGAADRRLMAMPHLFDGAFPGSKKDNAFQHEHPEMTKEVLKQIPEALTDPLAVVWSSKNRSRVFLLGLKADGKDVVVAVKFDEKGQKDAVVNLIKTAFGKNKGLNWLKREGANNNLRYVNREKMWRWVQQPGTISLSSPNAVSAVRLANADGSRIYNEVDLVKFSADKNRKVAKNTTPSDPLVAVHHIGGERTNNRLQAEKELSQKLHQDRGDVLFQKDGAEGEVRGSFSPSENTIKLTPNANLSTFSHEHSHWYLTNLFAHAGDENMSEAAKGDVAALLHAFGLKSMDEWNALSFEQKARYQEQYAAWTEKYLAEGKVPNNALAGVFKRFGEWLMNMYRDLLGDQADDNPAEQEIGERYKAQFGEELPALSPEVRKVLDRMYGVEKKMANFKPKGPVKFAARVIQSQRTNNDKVTAPLQEGGAPDAYTAAIRAQQAAATAMNTGEQVNVEQAMRGVPVNDRAVQQAQNSFARAFQMGDTGTIVVLQNRDRTGAVSVGQMNAIATAPDYTRLSVSRTTDSGAPIVSFGSMPDAQHQGRTEIVADSNGEKIPMTYAVVEADSVLRSNNFDGTPVAAYGADPSQVHAVAGNGRMAGLAEAYNRGTAEQYRQDLIADAASVGIDPAAVQGMQHPVLVRFMPPEKVTTGFIERSNSSNVMEKSALETAVQDSSRIRNNVWKYQFDEDGNPTPETMAQFLADIGEPNALGKLITADGRPTETALNRIRAAAFYEAYRDRTLTALVSDDTDKQGIKRILNAMAAFAPHVINIREASNGAIDLGPVLVDVVNRIRNAKIEGQPIESILGQGDMFGDNPAVQQVLGLFAENQNSAAGLARVLQPFAEAVENRLRSSGNGPQVGLFGEAENVTTDMADAMGILRDTQNRLIEEGNAALTEKGVTEGLREALPAVDVNAMRGTLQALVEAQKPAEKVAEAVVETVAPEVDPAREASLDVPTDVPLDAGLEAGAQAAAAHQAHERELFADNPDRTQVESLAEVNPEQVYTWMDDDGQVQTMTAKELLESDAEIDAQAETDMAGMATAAMCIIRNQGITE